MDGDPDAPPEGVKGEMPGGLRMLKPPHRLMAEPIAQLPPLYTEDMMREREAALSALGDTEDGRAIRLKMQSDMLVSDMSAFKAANPGSCLADFVRWHSPRDWISDENGDERVRKGSKSPLAPTGCLSERMRNEGNAWRTLWRDSPRLPASRQKPLFDPIREGEKALHHLEQAPPPEIFAQLCAAATSAVGNLYARAKGATLAPCPRYLARAADVARSVFNNSRGSPATESDYASLAGELQRAERCVARGEALRHRLPGVSARLLEEVLRVAAADEERRDEHNTTVAEKKKRAAAAAAAAATRSPDARAKHPPVVRDDGGDRDGGDDDDAEEGRAEDEEALERLRSRRLRFLFSTGSATRSRGCPAGSGAPRRRRRRAPSTRCGAAAGWNRFRGRTRSRRRASPGSRRRLRINIDPQMRLRCTRATRHCIFFASLSPLLHAPWSPLKPAGSSHGGGCRQGCRGGQNSRREIARERARQPVPASAPLHGIDPPRIASRRRRGTLSRPSRGIEGAHLEGHRDESRGQVHPTRDPSGRGQRRAQQGGEGRRGSGATATAAAVDASNPNRADWTCGKCGKSNFAKRLACFKCASPKPARVHRGGDEGIREATREARGEASRLRGGGRHLVGPIRGGADSIAKTRRRRRGRYAFATATRRQRRASDARERKAGRTAEGTATTRTEATARRKRRKRRKEASASREGERRREGSEAPPRPRRAPRVPRAMVRGDAGEGDRPPEGFKPANGWKLDKNVQNWLIHNACDESEVDDDAFAMFLLYAAGLRGGPLERMKDAAGRVTEARDRRGAREEGAARSRKRRLVTLDTSGPS